MLRRTLLRTFLTIPALIGPSIAWAASERPTYEQVRQWIGEYKASHRGNGGKDWDINAKTPEQIASEPDTKRLCELCGPDQRPVFPELAWEYGGSDHPWESPENAPLVYCVYTPQATPTAHWRFDEGRKRVTAHVYVLFPEQDPCRTMNAKEHIEACIGEFGNLEILSDTASLGDGRDLGFSLAEVSTELRLLRPNGKSTRLALIK